MADVFDALCSARPYKPAWPLDDAHTEISRGAGTQFDPAVVAAFERRWPEIETIYLEDKSRQPAPLSKTA